MSQCVECHGDVTGHPPKKAERRGRRATRNCLTCHDPHGSTNRSLVRQDLLWRRKITAIAFTSDQGVAPGGFTDASDPRQAICQTCHRDTDFYRRDGGGKPHFTDTCTLCHAHGDHFEPVASDANCGICHAAEAQRFAKPSGHSTAFAACSGCHAAVSPTPGPGHRAVEQCSSCHTDTMTHAPGGAGLPCTQCHDPHGTDNGKLVLDVLTTTQGTTVPIRFDNLNGRADGSFASASAPGTGVCEVCHTTTKFYRADGTGDPHFTFSCLPCHRHTAGFAPQ